MKRIAMLLAFFVCIGMQMTMAQTVQITGTITGAEDKQPLIGATVLVKGTSVGVNSDANGKYSINVPANGTTLLVSYIGTKTQEVAIGGRVKIDVELISESIGLEEVVVTSLAITKSQKALGYSVASVNSDEIGKSGQSTLMNSLQGKLAGVVVTSGGGLPGASTKVILRGYSSISGNNNPLYVVDGSPIDNTSYGTNGVDFGNGANDINPDDIETISISKGASANALYGSRAANGVILITTKKGKAGDKVKVEFSSNTTFSNPLRLPQNQNSFGQGWNGLDDLTQNGSWGPKFDGTIRPWGAIVDNSQMIKPYVALPNNIREYFSTGTSFNNSIALSGGNDFSKFYLSYNNTTEDGMIPGKFDVNKRNTFTAKGEIKGKKLTFKANANYVHRAGQNPPDGRGNSNASNLYSDIIQIPRDISLVDQKDYEHNVFVNSDNYFTPYAYNPYYSLQQVISKFEESRFYGNVSVDYDITKDLKATMRVGEDNTNFTREDWEAILTFTPGSYSQLGGKKEDPGYYSTRFQNKFEFNSDLLLTYNKNITDNIGLNVMVGYNVNERNANQLVNSVSTLDIPFYYNIQNSSSTPNILPYKSKRRLAGTYGEVDFSYKNLWFLSFTGRRDKSSTLPLDNNNFDYYGINSSLLLTELFPTLRNNYFSFGKLRFSYGTTGNDADPYDIKPVFVPGTIDNTSSIPPSNNPNGAYDANLNFPIRGVNAFNQSKQIGNTKLKPELSKEYEFGADLRFLDSRLRADITYYNKVTNDQILAVPISSSSGYSTQIMNFGSISNKGWEISITAIPVKTQNLEWSITWNWAKNHNLVEKLAPGLDEVVLQHAYDVDFVAIPGQPIGVFKGPVPIYDPNGRIVVNETGFPIPASKKDIYGNAQANYTAGISSSLTWKGLSFGFVMDIRQGGLMYSGTADLQYFAGNAVQSNYNDRQPFIVPNSVKGVQNPTTGAWTYSENTTPLGLFDVTDYYYHTKNPTHERATVISRSYTKLREVTLNYSIPKRFMKALPVSSASIGVYGKNLFIWTPSENNFIDPEVTSYGNDLAGDFGEFRTNPTARQFGISVKISF